MFLCIYKKYLWQHWSCKNSYNTLTKIYLRQLIIYATCDETIGYYGLMHGIMIKKKVILKEPARSQNEGQIFMKSSWKSFVVIQLYTRRIPFPPFTPRGDQDMHAFISVELYGYHERLCTL